MEYDGRRIRRFDRIDHLVIALAHTQYALRWVNDHFETRGHIGRGQRRPVVELDVIANLEGIGLAIIGRLRHHRAQIAYEIGRRRRIVRIDPDQHAVEWRGGVQHREGALAMPVKAWWRVCRDYKG